MRSGSGRARIIPGPRMSTEGTCLPLTGFDPLSPAPITENVSFSSLLESDMLCDGLRVSAPPEDQEDTA